MKEEFAAAGIRTPLVTSNRINTPEVAEQILVDGCADMVSLARPLLADPAFVNKAARGQPQSINTCIACNQACLDHIFKGKLTSCLVNPRACHETELNYTPAATPKRIAVVGAGPAGITAATIAANAGMKYICSNRRQNPAGNSTWRSAFPARKNSTRCCAISNIASTPPE